MATIMSRIEKFIEDNELESSMGLELEKLVKRCIGDLYEHVKDVPVNTTVKEKPAKAEKPVKVENPATAESRDDLRNCNKDVLNAYCKENGLRVGGTKKEIMDRVWRFLQEESSDEDISPRSEKAKKEKPVKKAAEKIDCCGKTMKGTPCASPAEDEMICGNYYCWRHAKAMIEEQKKAKDSASEKSESDSDDE